MGARPSSFTRPSLHSHRPRLYTLYSTGPHGDITNRSVCYPHSHPWVVEVRAYGIRQAYGLLNAGRAAARADDCGVITLERHHAERQPHWGWPPALEALIPYWMHGDRMVLVDAQGRVVTDFNGLVPDLLALRSVPERLVKNGVYDGR